MGNWVATKNRSHLLNLDQAVEINVTFSDEMEVVFPDGRKFQVTTAGDAIVDTIIGQLGSSQAETITEVVS